MSDRDLLRVAPELVWLDGAFQRGIVLEASRRTGRILGVVRDSSDGAEALPSRALIPGFVNAHSHAFQRLIRGHTQTRAVDAADFWSWRETMYRAALCLSPEDVYEVSRFAFIEMLRAGYTSVGEFHYLRNDAAGERYSDPNELAVRVLAAARDAGIRIRLLNVAYSTGAIGAPLAPEQRRFATPDLETFLRDTMDLVERARSYGGLVGLAPHSLRAVPVDWLAPLHSLAFGLDAPLHIHAAEQVAEVAACKARLGGRPIELLARMGVLDEYTTVVHATHVTRTEVELLAAQPGPTVCACPTTERDLGDGILPAAELFAAGARIALGSDSQSVIDPFEEARSIEYHERLRQLKRVILARPDSAGEARVAPALLEMATSSGARSLRLEAGELMPGTYADLVAVDLEHRALEGWTDDSLAAALMLGASSDVVTDVWVGGVRRVRDRIHAAERESALELRAVARKIFGPAEVVAG